MKRVLCLLLSFSLLLCLAACAAPSRPAPAEEELPEARHSNRRDEWEDTDPAETPAPETPPAETPGPPKDPGPVSPLMWKVSDGEGHTLYLFGTIHVGDERNLAVLEKIAPVLDSCDALAVEFDLVAYESDRERAARDLMQYVLTDGTTITDYMPKELYERAGALLMEAGLFPALFKGYNLAMWTQLVESAMTMVCSDLDTEQGMDRHLILHAYDRGIPVLDVESAEFQMSLLNGFEDELYLLILEETLDGRDSYGEDIAALYELWLSGDRDSFWDYLAGEEEGDGDEDYTGEQLAMIEDYTAKLLDERNLGMRDRAEEYLKSGQTVFFAVGAAHMANEVGLVRLLIEAGYTVEPYPYA